MTDTRGWARRFTTGLSSLRDRAANLRRRLAASRFNPSRRQRIIIVSIGNFIMAALFGAEGRVLLASLWFALAMVGFWELLKEADKA